jgi:muconolactone delta-isomerase
MEIMLRVDLAKPEALSNKEFYGIWLKETIAALEGVAAGGIKNIWKAAGKYQVIAVFDVENADQMDEAIHNLPIWTEGFSHIVTNIEWTPLRNYQNWSDHLKEMSGA